VVNPDAHVAYLRGRALLDETNVEGVRAAIDAFKQSVAIDPGYADAWAGLATAYTFRAVVGMRRGEEGPMAVRRAARRALDLDPDCAEALAVEGTLTLYQDRDYQRAGSVLRRALSLTRSNGLVYHPYADYLMLRGRMEESVEAVRRGAEIDPLTPLTTLVYAGHLIFARRYEDAIGVLREQMKSRPTPAGRNLLISALWHSGREEEALQLYRGDAAMAKILEDRGSMTPREVLRRAAARAVASLVPGAPLAPNATLAIAGTFARAGDREEALRWLERSYEADDPFILHIMVSPEYDFVRGDPRFKALLVKLHLDRPLQ
jgi:tetratricopeptide (TPR) repeat protein